MDEVAEAFIAFTVRPVGFYKSDMMPFDPTNAPVIFQRLMKTCLGELQLIWCVVYMGDIIVLSRTLKDHISSLGSFSKVEGSWFKLKPNKCEFFHKPLANLDHHVSVHGIETGSKKTQVIKDWLIFKTVIEVRSFWGLKN